MASKQATRTPPFVFLSSPNHARFSCSSLASNHANCHTPTDMELRFVKLSRSDTTRHHGTLRLVKDESGRVRTQVILDSRPEERQQDAGDSPDCRSRRLMRRPSPVVHTYHSPELWRNSFVQAMVADLFPKKIGYGRLVEADYAYHCSSNAWAPVIAIHDALTLLHVGSTSSDDSLLLEAKKRYVFCIGKLREALSPQGPQVSAEAILVVSMGLMLSEVLPLNPQSVSSELETKQIVECAFQLFVSC